MNFFFALTIKNLKCSLTIPKFTNEGKKLNDISVFTTKIVNNSWIITKQEYKDMADNSYSPLLIQPVIILVCEDQKLQINYRCRMNCGGSFSVCIENMFATDQDEANR